MVKSLMSVEGRGGVGGGELTVNRPKEMVPTNFERVTVALASGMLGVDDDLWRVRCWIVDAYRRVKLGRSAGSLLVSMKSTLLKPVLLASAARRYVRWRK